MSAGNIKKGVKIFGITGTWTGWVDKNIYIIQNGNLVNETTVTRSTGGKYNPPYNHGQDGNVYKIWGFAYNRIDNANFDTVHYNIGSPVSNQTDLLNKVSLVINYMVGPNSSKVSWRINYAFHSNISSSCSVSGYSRSYQNSQTSTEYETVTFKSNQAKYVGYSGLTSSNSCFCVVGTDGTLIPYMSIKNAYFTYS